MPSVKMFRKVISQSHVDLVLRGHRAFGDTGEVKLAYWHAEDGRRFVGIEEANNANNTTFEQHVHACIIRVFGWIDIGLVRHFAHTM